MPEPLLAEQSKYFFAPISLDSLAPSGVEIVVFLIEGAFCSIFPGSLGLRSVRISLNSGLSTLVSLLHPTNIIMGFDKDDLGSSAV